ncbi:hypothetical protein Q7C36_004096 [Tachysurus vachellii]|uniref:Uncharacterized protein n=1 Tax=Tachysurus vachellii TaxID=175792 RepID=A0AA88NMS3_TACVA|nr:hypothetical protein Q7C36_004096 [Tachysurus vachellii]
MYRYSDIQIQVLPPSSEEEWWDRLADLMSLRQQGRAVSCFAQLFWTCAAGLNLSDEELKLYLNDCLDEPFRWNLWETLDGKTIDSMAVTRPVSAPTTAAVTPAPTPKMAANMPVSDHKIAAPMPGPLSRRAIRRKRFASRTAVSAPTPKMATILPAPVFKRATTVSAPAVERATVLTTPVPQRAVTIPAPVVKIAAIPASQPLPEMAASPISPAPAKPQLLVSSLLDPQITSARVTKRRNLVLSSSVIPRATEVCSLSLMPPVLAMAPRHACSPSV